MLCGAPSRAEAGLLLLHPAIVSLGCSCQFPSEELRSDHETAREGARCNLAPGSARGIDSQQVHGGRGGGRHKPRGIIAAGLSRGRTRPCTHTLPFTSTSSLDVESISISGSRNSSTPSRLLRGNRAQSGSGRGHCRRRGGSSPFHRSIQSGSCVFAGHWPTEKVLHGLAP